MAWLFLLISGLLEVVWAIGLKYTDGFTKLAPSLFTISAMAVSFLFFSLALRTLPMGTAYAVWVGIGAAGVALVGMLYFGEPSDMARILCLILIVSGVIGLKLVTH